MTSTTIDRNMTLLDFFTDHYAPAKLASTSRHTRESYVSQLGKYRIFLNRDSCLRDLTAGRFGKYAEWIERKPLSRESKGQMIWILRRVWAFANESGLVQSGPPPAPRQPGRPRVYFDKVVCTAAPRRDVSQTLDTRGLGQETLWGFLVRYIVTRTDVKDTTRALLIRAAIQLERFFGPDRLLTSITPGDADEFRLHLNSKMGDNTARRTCGRAKQFFRAASRKRLITENPFADQRGLGVRGNKAREFFVTREMADRVLAACPSLEWRLIFALARYGGLRCPSEHYELRWSDVDWAAGRIRVTSPKTAYCGKPFRWIPLFPELRDLLTAAHARAKDEQEGFIISTGRQIESQDRPASIEPYRRGQNLRTTMNLIIRRAGLDVWPKVFQNCRSTRQTELAETFPRHVVCAWIGNTEIVAREHYLQMQDKYFEQAAKGGAA